METAIRARIENLEYPMQLQVVAHTLKKYHIPFTYDGTSAIIATIPSEAWLKHLSHAIHLITTCTVTEEK